MFQFAVYGKGGIGKSTVSANISYKLAERNKKVIQIGCDPKHDSTRLLLGGKEQRTVLEYIRDVPPYDRRLGDILVEGVLGIGCVEAGGPEPGIGCAGRGILTTFDTLKKLGMDDLETDVRIYDVLGDVVCGGFAVPLRSEYSDAVFLVTSGEFMSVYAANNILKGLRNFDKGTPRVAGIILNSRGNPDEYDTVQRFATAVGLPIITTVPRDRLFSMAEAEGCTVAQRFPGTDASKAFDEIADHVEMIMEGRTKLFHPRPLDDYRLSCYAKGLEIPPEGECIETVSACRCRLSAQQRRSELGSEKRLIQSCGAAGSVYPLLFLRDSVTILHGPRSCAHIMVSSRDLGDIRHGCGEDPVSFRMRCTDMDDSVSIFGGLEKLRRTAEEEIEKGCRTVFVVTACVSGIIGDNVEDLAGDLMREHPGVIVKCVMADGNIVGEWEKGYVLSAEALLDLVDTSVRPDRRYVNVIGERYFFKTGEHTTEVTELLAEFGLEVNCRFLYRSSVDDVRNFCRAGLTITCTEDRASLKISEIIEHRLGTVVRHDLLPVGMQEFRRYTEVMGEYTGKHELAERIRQDAEKKYEETLRSCRERLAGRKVLIVNKYLQDIDWLFESLTDLGMEILLVGRGTRHRWTEHGKTSSYSDRLRIVEDYGMERLKRDDSELRPDILLTDSTLMYLDGRRRMVYSRPGPGIEGILTFMRRLYDLTLVPAEAGWRDVE